MLEMTGQTAPRGTAPPTTAGLLGCSRLRVSGPSRGEDQRCAARRAQSQLCYETPKSAASWTKGPPANSTGLIYGHISVCDIRNCSHCRTDNQTQSPIDGTVGIRGTPPNRVLRNPRWQKRSRALSFARRAGNTWQRLWSRRRERSAVSAISSRVGPDCVAKRRPILKTKHALVDG